MTRETPGKRSAHAAASRTSAYRAPSARTGASRTSSGHTPASRSRTPAFSAAASLKNTRSSYPRGSTQERSSRTPSGTRKSAPARSAAPSRSGSAGYRDSRSPSPAQRRPLPRSQSLYAQHGAARSLPHKTNHGAPGSVRKVPPKKPPVQGRQTVVRRKPKRRIPLYLIAMWVVVLGLLCTIGVVWARGYYTDVVVEGVYVDGIDLAGKTYDQARALLEQERTRKLGLVQIHVTDPDSGQTWDWGAEDIGANIALDAVMEQVMQAGRTGNVFQRYNDVKELKETPLVLSTHIEFDEEKVDPLVASIAEVVNTDPVNAKVSFNTANSEKWTFTEEILGKEVDEALLVNQILEDLEGDCIANVEVVTNSITPAYTVELLQQSTQKRILFQTDVSGSDARKSNVKQALKALNGKIIWPGQELSFNATTGERTAENGYLEAPVIGANKGFEADFGGGVCQVSTTLYNAALMADCTIIKWRSHSFPSTYVAEGLDAVVNWPDKDLVIRNDTKGPMFIQATYYRDKAEVVIYRLPFDDGITQIKLTSTILYEGETPEANMIVDTTGEHVTYDDEIYKEVLSRPYLEVRNTQQFYRGTELVREEEIHVVKFQEIPGTYYVGATPASQRDSSGGGGETETESND